MDFFKDIEDIKNSFHKFASQTADDGLIIINGDMGHTDFILNGLSQKHVTFGLNPENDYTATDIAFDKEGNASYNLVAHGRAKGSYRIKCKRLPQCYEFSGSYCLYRSNWTSFRCNP